MEWGESRDTLRVQFKKFLTDCRSLNGLWNLKLAFLLLSCRVSVAVIHAVKLLVSAHPYVFIG